MKAIDILKQEHRVIEVVLNALEKMAGQCECKNELDAADAHQAIEFLRNFADRCHHGKEEDRLFPMMESRGISREGGPIGVMCMEHEEGRARIKNMDEAVNRFEGGETAALADFAVNANGYVALLRQHIEKEDHCLFSMAEQALSAEDQKTLEQQFDQFEHQDMGEGTHEKFLKIAHQLAEKYGIPSCGINNSDACSCNHQ